MFLNIVNFVNELVSIFFILQYTVILFIMYYVVDFTQVSLSLWYHDIILLEHRCFSHVFCRPESRGTVNIM